MKIETNIDNLKNYKIYLKIEQAVNEFLKKKGYLKVDLPVLSPALIPESYLEVFETEFRYLDKRQKLYLTPSPELFLKRLLVAGIGNCYYLGRSFRNSEPSSSWHQPEFTMLEFYKIGVNYLELANEILEMLRFISVRLSFRAKSRNLKKISPLTSFGRNDNRILFDKWEKMSVAEAFDKYAAINEKELFNPETFIKKAKSKGYKVDGATYKDLFPQILAAEVEPKLGKNGRPTLLYDYPRQLASLAKLSKDKKIADWLIDKIKEKIIKQFNCNNKTAEILGVASVKYSFLKNSTQTVIAFDIDESIAVDGNSAPYLIYTYVRCQSVLRKTNDVTLRKAQGDRSIMVSSTNHDELNLLRKFYQFPEVVLKTAENYSPNFIATYIYGLASQFNLFYQKNPILKSEKETKELRLLITLTTAKIIKKGLELLGIKTVEKM